MSIIVVVAVAIHVIRTIALHAFRRTFEQVLLAEGVDEKGVIETIVTTAKKCGVKVRRVPRRVIDDL